MSIRSEFKALIDGDKQLFKKEVYSILEGMLDSKFNKVWQNESNKLFEKTVCEKEEINEEVLQEVPVKTYMPIQEINDSINYDRTTWIVAKDGSQIEVTPKMAKYLAELYDSLNNTHKEKLVKLIKESTQGFKKAVKTAEKLYGDK